MSTTTPGAPAGTTAPGARIALWDNARFVLLVLVVFGHLVSTPRGESVLIGAAYDWVYAFHMPALFLVSGYFASAGPPGARSIVRSINSLIVPWLIFEAIWAVVRGFTGGEAIRVDFLVDPAWTLWFLVSLFTMRVLLPYLAATRIPLLLSSVAALAIPFAVDVGADFSAARTIALLPFFVLGWRARERGWAERAWFARPSAGTRIAAVVVAVGTLAATPWAMTLAPFAGGGDGILDRWLRWQGSYEEYLPGGTWAGPLVRLGLMLLALVLTVAVLLLVPRRASALTRWGEATLYIYLLHSFVVFVLRDSGVLQWAGESWPPLVFLLAALAAAVVIAIVLASRPVRAGTRFLVEPRLLPEPARERRPG